MTLVLEDSICVPFHLDTNWRIIITAICIHVVWRDFSIWRKISLNSVFNVVQDGRFLVDFFTYNLSFRILVNLSTLFRTIPRIIISCYSSTKEGFRSLNFCSNTFALLHHRIFRKISKIFIKAHLWRRFRLSQSFNETFIRHRRVVRRWSAVTAWRVWVGYSTIVQIEITLTCSYTVDFRHFSCLGLCICVWRHGRSTSITLVSWTVSSVSRVQFRTWQHLHRRIVFWFFHRRLMKFDRLCPLTHSCLLSNWHFFFWWFNWWLFLLFHFLIKFVLRLDFFLLFLA